MIFHRFFSANVRAPCPTAENKSAESAVFVWQLDPRPCPLAMGGTCEREELAWQPLEKRVRVV